MIKVAHICTTKLSYKVLQDKLVLLKKELEEYNIDIISSNEGPKTEFFTLNGIRQLYIDMDRSINPIKDIKSIYSMYKLLKKENYDIVHTHTAKAGIIGRIAAKLAKVPVIIHTSHGLPFFEGQKKIKYNIFKYLELFAIKISDCFASQNEEDLNTISKYVSKEKLFYEGNGIDIDKMEKLDNSISSIEVYKLRKELGIPENNKVILMAARFEIVKNHYLLLDALTLLKNKGINNFTCILAGKGELEHHIKNKVTEMNLEKNIIFLGYRKDIYKFIKLSDIVALTSLKEGIPRIIMESMYFEKAIIATDVLGTRELVVDNETGFMTELGDIESLANNIEILISNDNIRKQFGINGKKRIKERFTEQIVIKRIDNIYKTILKEKNVNSKN